MRLKILRPPVLYSHLYTKSRKDIHINGQVNMSTLPCLVSSRTSPNSVVLRLKERRLLLVSMSFCSVPLSHGALLSTASTGPIAEHYIPHLLQSISHPARKPTTSEAGNTLARHLLLRISAAVSLLSSIFTHRWRYECKIRSNSNGICASVQGPRRDTAQHFPFFFSLPSS